MKTLHAPLVRSLSGSIAELTFQSTRAGPIARAKPSPPTPSSSAQLANQANLAKIAALHNDMHPAYRAAWTPFAHSHLTSTFAAFTAANFTLELQGEARTFAPPNPLIPPIVITAVLPSFSSGWVKVLTTSPPGLPNDLLRWLFRRKGDPNFHFWINGYVYWNRYTTTTYWSTGWPATQIQATVAVDDAAGSMSITASAFGTTA